MRRPANALEPRIRRGTIRVSDDIAWRLRAGHPWVFRDSLGGRPMREAAGDVLDVVDDAGAFVARGLFDPTGPIAIRIFSRHAGTLLDAASIRTRVERAKRLRELLLDRDLTAYRVIHGEADGLPGIAVERHDEYLVAHVYSPVIEPLRPAIYDALTEAWRPRAIYEQRRYRPQTGEGPRAPAELVRGEPAPVEIQVRENGLLFGVDVTAPLGTGLFVDLRLGRQAIGRLAQGRRVLNLFSYTGAFSLYAAKGGASEVVSVDLAPKAHGRARRNLALNGLGESGHEFITGDALKVLARMRERRRAFDLVLIDPPSFSQAKGHVFAAQKDYRDLIAAALGVLVPEGLLACASNMAKLPLEDFDRIVGDGAHVARRDLAVVERYGLPPDFPIPAGFPEGHYLKFEICRAS